MVSMFLDKLAFEALAGRVGEIGLIGRYGQTRQGKGGTEETMVEVYGYESPPLALDVNQVT